MAPENQMPPRLAGSCLRLWNRGQKCWGGTAHGIGVCQDEFAQLTIIKGPKTTFSRGRCVRMKAQTQHSCHQVQSSGQVI